MLCATYYVHCDHTGATHFSFTITEAVDARMAYVHVYYQKNVATIETMSEESERIKAKV